MICRFLLLLAECSNKCAYKAGLLFATSEMILVTLARGSCRFTPFVIFGIAVLCSRKGDHVRACQYADICKMFETNETSKGTLVRLAITTSYIVKHWTTPLHVVLKHTTIMKNIVIEKWDGRRALPCGQFLLQHVFFLRTKVEAA